MKVTVDNNNRELVISVEDSVFSGINIFQDDDLIYIEEDKIREFVAAVRAVASHLLGEEV